MKGSSKLLYRCFAVFALACLAAPASWSQTFRAVPLIDFKPGNLYLGKYQGFLYPGSNEMPAAHATDGMKFLSRVLPLDTSGRPSAQGKIVVLGFGMSNWTLGLCQLNPTTTGSSGTIRTWVQACTPNSFLGQAYQNVGVDKQHLVIVDCAISGHTTRAWVNDAYGSYSNCRDNWLTPFGLSEAQVQVILWEDADAYPAPSGYKSLSPSTVCSPSSKVDACHYENLMGQVIRYWKSRYPNLKQAFLHCRVYGVYARTQLNPEPYAYEYGFATKWLIEAQINQVATGKVDATSGDLSYQSAPWLAWGPYLWASGQIPRSDGLTWTLQDFRFDGTHPSPSGVEKIAGVVGDTIEPYGLLTFYLQSPFTAWFRLQ